MLLPEEVVEEPTAKPKVSQLSGQELLVIFSIVKCNLVLVVLILIIVIIAPPSPLPTLQTSADILQTTEV